MVKATKIAVSQIRKQELNKRAKIIKLSNVVNQYYKIIVMIVVFGLLVRSINSLFSFVVIDKFFERQYKEDYKEWKQLTEYTRNKFMIKGQEKEWERMS